LESPEKPGRFNRIQAPLQLGVIQPIGHRPRHRSRRGPLQTLPDRRARHRQRRRDLAITETLLELQPQQFAYLPHG
jgi:hypothetical protein